MSDLSSSLPQAGATPLPAGQGAGENRHNPGMAGELSAQQIETARATWLRQGLPADRFDAAFGLAPSVPVQQPTTPGPDKPQVVVEGGAVMTAAQAEAYSNHLRASGMSEEAIAAELQRHGMVEDTRTPNEMEWDEQHRFGTYHQPSAYKIDINDAGLRGKMDVARLMVVQKNWGTFLASMQIEPAIGSYIAERTIAGVRERAGLSEAQKTLWRQEQNAALLRRAGSQEKLAEWLGRVDDVLKLALENAGTNRQAVHNTMQSIAAAGGFDAASLEFLSNHGAKWNSWRAGLNRR